MTFLFGLSALNVNLIVLYLHFWGCMFTAVRIISSYLFSSQTKNLLKDDDTKMGIYNSYYNESYPIKPFKANPSCRDLRSRSL